MLADAFAFFAGGFASLAFVFVGTALGRLRESDLAAAPAFALRPLACSMASLMALPAPNASVGGRYPIDRACSLSPLGFGVGGLGLADPRASLWQTTSGS